MAEPDLEKVTRGSRDGFVETLLLNANLIRRRVRSPRLCFSMHSVGTESRTDDIGLEILYQIVLHIQRILQVGEDLLQDLRLAESVYTQKISPPSPPWAVPSSFFSSGIAWGAAGFCGLSVAESVYTQKISPGFAKQEIAGHKIKADTQGQGSFQMLYIFFQMFGQSVDGFDHAVLIDVRTYPTRGMAEPDLEKVTRGSRVKCCIFSSRCSDRDMNVISLV